MYEDKGLVLSPEDLKAGRVSWKSPSNIALIKYWGKRPIQIPQNPSISFTLENAWTQTEIDYDVRKRGDSVLGFEFLFESKPAEGFHPKLSSFFKRVSSIFPFISNLHLKISSKNSFPHSAGIASSASAMSALALCLCSIEEELSGQKLSTNEFYKKASYVSRLGSGSACRSVFPSAAVWGRSHLIDESSDDFAIPYEHNLHPIFKDYHNDILIVSREPKGVSSTEGHQLMENNIYAPSRYKQANLRLERILDALKLGDLESFGQIVENEALSLHAMMMASHKSFILLKANSLNIIEKIRSFRADTSIPLYFSIDAGPNPHLMYPDVHAQRVKAFIKEELLHLCDGHQCLEDQVGKGPLKLQSEHHV